MATGLYAVSDIGATNHRTMVFTPEMEPIGRIDGLTDPKGYEATVQDVSDNAKRIAGGAEIVVASIVIAGRVDNGEIMQAGDLNGWIGQNIGHDLAHEYELDSGLVVVANDVEGIAISQQGYNEFNGQYVNGIASTISSGFNAALYEDDGKTTHADEAGHEHLKDGATCPCGHEGHIEAYISGKGVQKNHGVDMKTWLAQDPQNQAQLAQDIAASFVAIVERHMSSGFEAEEFRWTGSVALRQPGIMWRAVNMFQERWGVESSPVFDTITWGEDAGLHGGFVNAARRAQEY